MEGDLGALGLAWVDGIAWEIGWVGGGHCDVFGVDLMSTMELEGALRDVSEVSGGRVMVVLKA